MRVLEMLKHSSRLIDTKNIEVVLLRMLQLHFYRRKNMKTIGRFRNSLLE